MKMSENVHVNVEKQYQCKYCKKLIHGKYVILHLKMKHGIELNSWKLLKILQHYSESGKND